MKLWNLSLIVWVVAVLSSHLWAEEKEESSMKDILEDFYYRLMDWRYMNRPLVDMVVGGIITVGIILQKDDIYRVVSSLLDKVCAFF